MSFKVTLIAYETDISWVERTLVSIRNTLHKKNGGPLIIRPVNTVILLRPPGLILNPNPLGNLYFELSLKRCPSTLFQTECSQCYKNL